VNVTDRVRLPGVFLPELIFVNGPSSAGKTTLSRALQAAVLARRRDRATLRDAEHRVG
jgi:chloramphenicol 3-O-phosphotransferase